MSDMSWGLFLYLCSPKDRRFNSLSIDAGKECQADVLSNNDVITCKYFPHGFVRFRRVDLETERKCLDPSFVLSSFSCFHIYFNY